MISPEVVWSGLAFDDGDVVDTQLHRGSFWCAVEMEYDDAVCWLVAQR
jgi:hypothetical protein